MTKLKVYLSGIAIGLIGGFFLAVVWAILDRYWYGRETTQLTFLTTMFAYACGYTMAYAPRQLRLREFGSWLERIEKLAQKS